MCILYYKQLWIQMIFKAKQNPNFPFGKSFFTWDYWEKGQTASYVLKVCLKQDRTAKYTAKNNWT